MNFIQKSIAFMYNNNELSERESKKRIPSKIALEKNIYIYIYLGINLTKKMRDLHSKNYKTLKEIEDDTKKWKDILCS